MHHSTQKNATHHPTSFSKILVANRGEIAVRAFRAAFETGASTVAVYPMEDRNSFHRSFASEAVLIGEGGSAVKAYLDIDEVIRAAKQTGADAVYPAMDSFQKTPNWPGNAQQTDLPSSARLLRCST